MLSPVSKRTLSFPSGIRTPNLLDQNQALCRIELKGIKWLTEDSNVTESGNGQPSVGSEGVEPSHLAVPVLETGASAIPPAARRSASFPCSARDSNPELQRLKVVLSAIELAEPAI